MSGKILQSKITIPADLYTPVGLYLRLRDQFRGSALLECSDFHQQENSRSIICCDSISKIEYKGSELVTSLPGMQRTSRRLSPDQLIPTLQEYISELGIDSPYSENGLYGHFNFEAAECFDSIELEAGHETPIVNFSLYRFVLVLNHFHDSMTIVENIPERNESQMSHLLSLIGNGNSNAFSFSPVGEESSTSTADEFLQMVEKGKGHCQRGDVFQIVLSRSFSQQFSGDEFQVYRALRSLNPSPYLFFFDLGDYKLMGSSPEAQLTIKDKIATINPIAGTYKRTGNDGEDSERALKLAEDPKENAEHTMLVDLARNDLNRIAKEVKVKKYKEIQFYSHVIHLVSTVQGELEDENDGLRLFAASFPAGTLSGAPKFKAMQLIADLETGSRGFYGGSIGHLGLDGSINQAILIRSIISRNNHLRYQAGAGIVSASVPQSELEEVDNKLGALRKAIQLAGKQNK